MVSVGELLQIVTTIGGLLLLAVRLERRITRLETRLAPVWSDFLVRRSQARARSASSAPATVAEDDAH